MFWIVLLALHLTGLTGYTLLLRKSALGSIDKTLLAALLQTAVFIPVPFAILASGGVSLHLAAWQWSSLIVNALTIVGIQVFGVLVLKHLEASMWTVIFNLRLVFTTLLGVLVLGELPTPLQLLGGLVIFASIVALNLHRNRQYRSRPILLGLLATIFFSLHATLEKFNITSVGALPYFFVSGGLAAAVLWLLVLQRGIKLPHIAGHADWHMARLLALRSLSAWGYVLALPYVSLAIANYVSGMSVALIVVFGVFYLKERDHLREKFTALGIAVAGLTLILIGHK